MTIDRKRWPIEHDDCFVSGLEVLRSGAGYFIGRTCLDKVRGYLDVYSRESDYYPTEKMAARALETMAFDVRDCAENNAAYEVGALPLPKAN